jgi:hypothetical protein
MRKMVESTDGKLFCLTHGIEYEKQTGIACTVVMKPDETKCECKKNEPEEE